MAYVILNGHSHPIYFPVGLATLFIEAGGTHLKQTQSYPGMLGVEVPWVIF